MVIFLSLLLLTVHAGFLQLIDRNTPIYLDGSSTETKVMSNEKAAILYLMDMPCNLIPILYHCGHRSTRKAQIQCR